MKLAEQHDNLREQVYKLEIKACDGIKERLQAAPENKIVLFPAPGATIAQLPTVYDKDNIECHVIAIKGIATKGQPRPMLMVLPVDDDGPDEAWGVYLYDCMGDAPALWDYLEEHHSQNSETPSKTPDEKKKV